MGEGRKEERKGVPFTHQFPEPTMQTRSGDMLLCSARLPAPPPARPPAPAGETGVRLRGPAAPNRSCPRGGGTSAGMRPVPGGIRLGAGNGSRFTSGEGGGGGRGDCGGLRGWLCAPPVLPVRRIRVRIIPQMGVCLSDTRERG